MTYNSPAQLDALSTLPGMAREHRGGEVLRPTTRCDAAGGCGSGARHVHHAPCSHFAGSVLSEHPRRARLPPRVRAWTACTGRCNLEGHHHLALRGLAAHARAPTCQCTPRVHVRRGASPPGLHPSSGSACSCFGAPAPPEPQRGARGTHRGPPLSGALPAGVPARGEAGHTRGPAARRAPAPQWLAPPHVAWRGAAGAGAGFSARAAAPPPPGAGSSPPERAAGGCPGSRRGGR